VAGGGTAGFSGDGGSALSAGIGINDPRGVALDQAGNLHIDDYGNARIRKVTLAGIITTVAGNGIQGFSGDGGQATSAELNEPYRARPDTLGKLFIADAGKNRVRKVAPNGIITTIAGNGVAASTGDSGQATSASLNYPADVLPDGDGNLFIVESFGERIGKIDAQGIITTVAGSCVLGYSGDSGPATQVAVNNPNVLTLDPAGNLVISDENNNRIRKVTNDVIATLAGNGVQSYAGDGGVATAAALYTPVGAAFDAAGNTYIADGGNNRIRIVLPNGAITTLAGTGSSGYNSDGGLATAAAIGSPHTLEPTPFAGFYFADNVNNRIRFLTPPVAPSVGTVVSASGFRGFAARRYNAFRQGRPGLPPIRTEETCERIKRPCADSRH
jgi:hypothetical protein